MTVENSLALVSSIYNFRVPIGKEDLLYNSKTGAVLSLQGRDALTLAQVLSGKRTTVPEDCLSLEVLTQLLAGGFVIPAEVNELAEIRNRYQQARKGTPIVLTLTTTLDCNLGCYYCYEERSRARLTVEDVDSIVALAHERLKVSGKRSLHVDWYGGEPMMNLEFIEQASSALQRLCDREQVAYAASVISNGTSWPENSAEFVQQHKIRQVQISFDGLREHHNRRRRYRKSYLPEGEASSFDRAVKLVDRLLDYVRVDIRLNIDRANQEDVIPFIHFVRSRGWLNRRYPAVIQPARLASYSEHSAFMRKSELTADEYDSIRAVIRKEIGQEARIEESEVPNGFPYPKTSVCAALANDSVVIGADGHQYRCGLQVSEPHRAVGDLQQPSNPGSDSLLSDASWWEQFDPTTLPTCSRCSFLPICWGGCPKKHLEGDTHAIAEQGAYWRKNLPRLIATKVGVEAPPDFVYGETDQFRQDE